MCEPGEAKESAKRAKLQLLTLSLTVLFGGLAESPVHTVKSCLQALGLHNFLRGFEGAYNLG